MRDYIQAHAFAANIRMTASQQETLDTCHSEAGFIGEESAFSQALSADSSRNKAARRNDKIL
jgi:hypothetical protein